MKNSPLRLAFSKAYCRIRSFHVVVSQRMVKKVPRWRYHASWDYCTAIDTFGWRRSPCYGVAVLVYVRSLNNRHLHNKLNVPSASTCPCYPNWKLGQSSTLDHEWPQSPMPATFHNEAKVEIKNSHILFFKAMQNPFRGCWISTRYWWRKFPFNFSFRWFRKGSSCFSKRRRRSATSPSL